MRRLLVVLTAMCLFPPAAAADGVPLPPTPSAALDVNVVFIGFAQKQYYGHESEPHDPRAIYSDVLDPIFLPHTADPIIRFESYPTNVPADYHVDLHNHIAFAPKRIENAFFDELARIGRPAPTTLWQQLYNDESTNALDVTGRTLLIPGPAVEKWLEANLGNIPGTVPGGHTVVFINWFGRPGFRFHAYQGTGVDPNTGQDQRDGNFAGSAWGGSTGRLWFYDMSAGPERWNYAADFGWNFQVPPIWEMNPDAYGHFTDATEAAGVLARVDLYSHAVPSPVYDPLISAPPSGSSRVIRWNLFDGNPSIPQPSYFTRSYSENAIGDLQPYFPVTGTLDRFGLEGDDKTAFEIFDRFQAGLPGAPGCWQTFGARIAGEELICYIAQNPARFSRPAGPGDKVITAMLYNISAQESAIAPFIGGVADNFDDGTPAEVFGTGAPSLYGRDPFFGTTPGWAMSTLMQHEIGHYVGLSHPHDGYDSEIGYFAANINGPWLNSMDECQCPMGYIFKGLPFGVFDHDSLDRTLAARYYATAYDLLPSLDARTSATVQRSLGSTLNAFQRLDWRTAVLRGRTAFETALGAAPHAAAAAAIAQPAHGDAPANVSGLVEKFHDPRSGGTPATPLPTPGGAAGAAYAHNAGG